MPRAHRSTIRRGRAQKPPSMASPPDASVVLSAEEKRQLILAHAEAREHHPSLGFGYYIGIAASCLVILSGWFLTLDRNLRTDLPFLRGSGLEEIQANTAALQKNLSSTNAQSPSKVEALRDQLLKKVTQEIRQSASSSTVLPTTKP